MKAKRPAADRGAERRRTPRQPDRNGGRRPVEAPARRGRPARERGAVRRTAPATGPIPRPSARPASSPVGAPARPKTASQAKARAKARKAKAPKVVRPPLKQRLALRLAEVELDPRALVARVPFVVLVIGALATGLGVTLWLSTGAAERSYQLGAARETNQGLLQQKEALERDVLEAQAAPALAEAARGLGMIPSRDTAHLVQDPAGNWVVVGTPKPAEGVPPPPLNTPLPDAAPAPAAAASASPPAPRVVDPREVTVRVPGRTDQPASPSGDSHGVVGGPPPAPGPVQALALPAPPEAPAPVVAPPPPAVFGSPPGPALEAAPAPAPAPAPEAFPLPAPAPDAPPVPAEQFAPVTAPLPGPQA